MTVKLFDRWQHPATGWVCYACHHLFYVSLKMHHMKVKVKVWILAVTWFT